jgi:hypothetical protein
MTPRDPREQPMRQHRPIDHDRHRPITPPAKHGSPAITHQLVSVRWVFGRWAGLGRPPARWV